MNKAKFYLSMSGTPADFKNLPTIMNLGQGTLNDELDSAGNLLSRENASRPINFGKRMEQVFSRVKKGGLVMWDWEPSHEVDYQYYAFVSGDRTPAQNAAAVYHHAAALRGFKAVRPDIKISTCTAFPVWGEEPWRNVAMWPEYRRVSQLVIEQVIPLCDWLPVGLYYDTGSTAQDPITKWYEYARAMFDRMAVFKQPLVAWLSTHYMDHADGRKEKPIPGQVFDMQVKTLVDRAPIEGICVFGQGGLPGESWPATVRQYASNL